MYRALLVAVLLLAGCNNDAPPPPVQQTAACPVWTAQHSPSMPDCVGMSFKFPQRDGAHYFVRKAPALRLGQKITIKFNLEGTGRLVPVGTGDEPPARLRLFIQRKGDTLMADHEDYRWWSEPIDLTEMGWKSITVEITPALWSQVFGRNGATRPDAFRRAIEDAAHVGFTFGGMFAGHGVKAIGDVTLTITQYTVE
jgi:hypothetical protein